MACWKFIHPSLDFSKFIVRFEVGNWSRVLFWQNNWRKEQPLKLQSSKLFKMTSLRDGTVQVEWESALLGFFFLGKVINMYVMPTTPNEA